MYLISEINRNVLMALVEVNYNNLGYYYCTKVYYSKNPMLYYNYYNKL